MLHITSAIEKRDLAPSHNISFFIEVDLAMVVECD